MATKSAMHIVRLYPEKAVCSGCDYRADSTNPLEIRLMGTNHAEWNRPAAVIDYIDCSEECIKDSEYRNLHVSVHLDSCPNKLKDNTNG